MQYLSSTGELVTSGLVECIIGANAKEVGLTLDEINVAIAKVTFNWEFLSHAEQMSSDGGRVGRSRRGRRQADAEDMMTEILDGR